MLLPGDAQNREAATSAANWQEAPFNRWAFWNLREVLPTQRISRGSGPARILPDETTKHDLLGVAVIRVDGTQATVADVLAETFTDAFGVLQQGDLVAEAYHPTGGPSQAHAVLSVTKSVVGCVAGILIGDGVLETDRDVDAYVPELSDSGFAGATIRDLLDMRSGVRFREEYTNPNAEVRRLDRWLAGDTRRSSASPRGLYPFLTTLRAEAPHGSPVPLPVRGDRCSRVGVRTSVRDPDGRADLDTGLDTDGCRARRRDPLRPARDSRP